MSINFSETTTSGFWFFESQQTETKQQTPEEFLKFQRKHLFDKKDKSDTYEIPRGTRTYNDQSSINSSLFEYADKDSNGKIDESEYKYFLAESISDGAIGKYSSDSGVAINVKGGLSFADSSRIIPDYKELTKVLDLYNNLIEADRGIDENDDGFLSREEFYNSASLTLMTNQDKDVLQKLFPEESKFSYLNKRINAASISDGIIGKVTKNLELKSGYDINSQSFTHFFVFNENLSPDFDELVEVADKYHKKLN